MFTWYLCREILKPFILITAILSALLVAGEMSDILGRVVSGQYSDWAIVAIIGYQLPILIPELLPAAFFLAALTSLNRMSEESERIVLHAIGQSDSGILVKVIGYTAIPAMVVMLLFTHWLTPLAEGSLTRYIIEQQNRPLTDIVTPGEFFSLNKRETTLYARRSNPAEGTLLSVFMVRVDDGRIAVNTAPSARIENQLQRQYLTLFNGAQRVFSLEPDDTEQINYRQFALYIPSVEADSASASKDAASTSTLWNSSHRSLRSEAINRTLLPALIPVLAVWAVALTRVKPRKGRVGAVALGIVLYILITFGQRTLQTSVEKGQLPLLASPWWYLLFLAGIALLLVRRRA
ncbi:LPS export ABC transporter permease LptF [Saccharospirillum mangrovi]|uniref:LPS export ABC transporter permease LptF n=1 Tax=Saccharospirillum mangrovi TaxID=2161747 RepID=UPI001300597D|nr:LPS export ABC transporter permease LptF [Saccharospirillum mangrovi]